MAACSEPRVWQTGGTQRRHVTVEIDGSLVKAARSVAERAGVPEDEPYERALREVLARDFGQLHRRGRRSPGCHRRELTDEEAMDLAARELPAVRAERREAS